MRTLAILLLIGFSGTLYAQKLSLLEFYNYTKSGNTLAISIISVEDSEGILTPYIGTWSGTVNDKTLKLYISKERSDYGDGLFVDVLEGRYSITESNGTVLIDTRNLPIDHPSLLHSDNYKERTIHNYLFESGICGNQLSAYYEFDPALRIRNQDQMKFIAVISNSEAGNEHFCPNGYNDPVIPVNQEFILVRQ